MRKNRVLPIEQKLLLSFLMLSMLLILSLFTEKVTIIRPVEPEQGQTMPNNASLETSKNN